MIRCPKCEKKRELMFFSANSGRRNKRNSWCKFCMKEYYENNKIALFEKHKKYRQKNREKLSAQKKEYTLKNKKKLANKECLRKYGITLEEKSVQNIQQNNLCLGCRGKMGKNIVVDHDHITGKVRGLLHSNCNVILGYVHDNPETLRSLAAYLESSL